MIYDLAYSNRYNIAALHRKQAKPGREFVKPITPRPVVLKS
jgi:hypothetical protein